MAQQDGADPWQNGHDPWAGQNSWASAAAAAARYRGAQEPEPPPTAAEYPYGYPAGTHEREDEVYMGEYEGSEGSQQAPQPQVRVFMTGEYGAPPVEPPAGRIIHDVPPVWDGTNPENQTAPYLKALRGWLNTTRAQKTQVAMTILHYAQGDLRLIINELDVDELTAADSGEKVYQHVQK